MRAQATASVLCLGLLGGPLAAGDSTFGGQIALIQPQSDLNGGKWLHGRAGVSAGLHGLFDLGYSHALRPRADLSLIQGGTINIIDSGGDSQQFAQDAKTRILAVGLDYNFYIMEHHLEGPYTIVGLGYAWASFSGARLLAGGAGTPPAVWPSNQSAGAIQYALGMGWKASPHLGGEFRFTQSTFRDIGVPFAQVKAPAFSLSLTVEY